MRPHRLRVTAFGPFAGTVEVDLDEVSSAGPFLLRGATGAGKTSLLDAVGYALFGKVPGSRGLKQLRSDHAADGVRTCVELWATVGGRAVHVVRTPDQRRPKARGAGTTTDKATVSVRVAADLPALEADECDGRWSGVQEANDELARLVGMTHEQFVQVVLLPQGEFARFLRARDEDRAEVLRALFDTRRFRAVEHHLREQRDRARAALADSGARVAAAAARVAAAGGALEPPASGLPGWAEGLLVDARAVLGAASERAQREASVVAGARSRHAAAQAVAERLHHLVLAAGTQASLLDRAPAVALVAEELEAAERAVEVSTLHAVQEEARRRVGAAAAAAAAATTAAGLAGPRPGPVGDGPDGFEASDRTEGCEGSEGVDRAAVQRRAEAAEGCLRSARDWLAAIEATGGDVERWRLHRAGLDDHRAALGGAERRLRDVRTSVAALPGRVTSLEADLERDRPVAAGLSRALHRAERWERLVLDGDRLLGHVEEVAAAEAEHLRVRAVAREAEQEHDGLRRARLAGMSVELAAALVPGQPCTVCGATEHPAPADGAGATVAAEEEEQAARRAARAAEAAGRAGTAFARAAARRDACRDQVAAAVASHDEPGTDEPGTDEPGTDEQGTDEPGTDEPGTDEPGTDEVSVEPGTDEQGTDEVSVVPAALVVPGTDRLDQAALESLGARLAARAGAARAALTVAQAAASRTETTAAELAAARTALDAAAPLLAQAESDLAGCRAAVATSQAEVARLRAQLVDVLGPRAGEQDPAAVREELLSAARQQVEQAEAESTALVALVAALLEVDRAAGAVVVAAHEAGWPDAATALAATRSRTWREDARLVVTGHDRDLHAASGRVLALRHELGEDGEDLDAQAGRPLVALVGTRARRAADREQELAAELADAEAAWLDADRDRTRAAARLAGLVAEVPPLLAAERGTGPLREEAEAAGALADLCSGVNDKGVPLSTYVLAAHLEQVVEAANLRLRGMSDGRYALVHVEEGEDRRRRAGLGLAVLDGWTGRRRPAGTLSGGETFLASLALALGLADVVTAEAGGARLDALFVDEGFGTLDPDSLDRAMDVLDALQQHGRMVGVVSHVTELQQRLPRQVHVEAGRAGSTVRVLSG